METLVQQLERVQTAIAAIESGAQEYGIGSRKVTKGDLKTLYEREASLKQQLAYETVGTTRAYARWPTR
ncbi:MAG TPA: hypothetical protein PKA28_10785 [Methylomusa anaerophila]|uniref:Uncharacterized protein n=1 Tax=Methylomusa anaerophila TaxID=1930071 RepID=A0A348AIZ8_9FIRM|nr:hypothetical protein [Methylomusa anaerophila]BBB91046.1 hypothetical protein MAMMFC1_01714 [Methylomusa anaerophila]HML88920.1 hypothetical protein [Methylomusa anaerophila]